MLESLLLAAALLQYGIGPDTQLQYESKVTLTGFLPLLGGSQGTVGVTLDIAVDGLESTGDTLGASSELKGFKLVFNGAPLDFISLDQAKEYFPKGEVRFTPAGQVTKGPANAPSPPIRLPGLDVERFPDISYLPLVFPKQKLEVGDKWKFSKRFGGEPLSYECELLSLADDKATVGVKIEQTYTVFENEALEIVEEADAVAKAKTELSGTGMVWFDLKRGIATKIEMDNDATSTVTDIETGEVTKRELATQLRVKLVGNALTPAKSEPATLFGRLQDAWHGIVASSTSAIGYGQGLLQLIRWAISRR